MIKLNAVKDNAVLTVDGSVFRSKICDIPGLLRFLFFISKTRCLFLSIEIVA